MLSRKSARSAAGSDAAAADSTTYSFLIGPGSTFSKQSGSPFLGQLYREPHRREGRTDGAVRIEGRTAEEVSALEPDTLAFLRRLAWRSMVARRSRYGSAMS